MENYIQIAQITISVSLSLIILLQVRGTSGNLMGSGAGETFRSKRGLEKFFYNATIVLAILLVISSVISSIYAK